MNFDSLCKFNSAFSKVFNNKLILITGGSSGIGLALARELINYDAKLVIISHHPEKLFEAQKKLTAAGGDVTAFECDISDMAQVTRLKQQVLQIGVPDMIINNAGYSSYRTFEDTPLMEIEHLVAVNLNGALRVTHAFLKEMILRKSGRIINVSSVTATMMIVPHSIYHACKAGMLAWTRGLAIELKPFQIKVQAICPGRVQTDFFKHPSFIERLPRRETAISTPMRTIIYQILQGIANNTQVIYTPRIYRYISWALSTFAWILEPIYFPLLRNRIKTYYLYKKESRSNITN